MTVVAGEYADAGWYDDGVTAGVLRWFDGTAWSEHTRPALARPTAVPGPVVTTAAPPTTFAPGHPAPFGPELGPGRRPPRPVAPRAARQRTAAATPGYAAPATQGYAAPATQG
ncbi:DUF2510 domain-containing protein, partial [Cellulomonas sp. URHD0024]|uniref:DUF2510 domain-containing protein n=1 Tax=Cellulomonas sp. URHD0024 TaxID=1302620 RepID=UPI0012DFBED3